MNTNDFKNIADPFRRRLHGEDEPITGIRNSAMPEQ